MRIVVKLYAGKTTVAFINTSQIKCRVEVNLEVNILQYNILAKNKSLGCCKSFKFSAHMSVCSKTWCILPVTLQIYFVCDTDQPTCLGADSGFYADFYDKSRYTK